MLYLQLAPVSRYWAKFIVYIDMKLGPVTKLDKKNKKTSKKMTVTSY